MPRADGGQTSWTNIVAACSPCNTRKDRFHLKPRRKPFEPTQHRLDGGPASVPAELSARDLARLLYWDVELEK